jgi:hypothetical protein
MSNISERNIFIGCENSQMGVVGVSKQRIEKKREI